MIEGHTSPCDEGVFLGEPECRPYEESVKRWVLVTSILGSSLAFIVGSVVNVALPAIQDGLEASGPQMQWVLSAYLLFLGALILAGGAAGDHYGKRNVFAAGVLIFAFSSVLCGLAPSIEWLIVARGVQGLGGALLVPNSLALLAAFFTKDERGSAIGTWAGFSAITTALGPMLGGWIVDASNWRWVFFVVIPFAVLTLWITYFKIPEKNEASSEGGLDLQGALLATAGIGLLTYGLISSSNRGWLDIFVLTALGASILLFAIFLRVEQRQNMPMIPMSLFKSSTFSGANIMTAFLYFGLSGALYFLPFNLIQVQGYSATQAGAAFLPFTLMIGVLSRWSGWMTDRFGARTSLIAGPFLAGIGMGLLAVPTITSNYWTSFFPGMLVLGLGMTISIAPLTTVVINVVDDSQSGLASGINNAAARIASLLAIAVLGMLAIQFFGDALNPRLTDLSVPETMKEAVWGSRNDLAAAKDVLDTERGDNLEIAGVIDHSFLYSFRIVMLICAGLAWASSLCALWLVKPDHLE